MNRPLLSRLLPPRLKESLYYRRYHRRHGEWGGLFAKAPLALCPQVAMYDLVQGDVISGNLAFHGFYEWSLSERVARDATEGTLFVDVGANMGYFTMLWAGVNPAGRAVAFEASPRNVRLLENNVARNGFEPRVRVVAKAAGDRDGMVTFETGPADQTGWGGIAKSATSTSITVPLVRLDRELADETIDVLKIDVEGADTWVIQGCRALLEKKRIRRIYFEQNEERMQGLGIAPETATRFLEGLGYRCESMGGDPGQRIAYPVES